MVPYDTTVSGSAVSGRVEMDFQMDGVRARARIIYDTAVLKGLIIHVVARAADPSTARARPQAIFMSRRSF